MAVSVCSGGSIRTPQTQGLIKDTHLFLTLLEAGGLGSGTSGFPVWENLPPSSQMATSSPAARTRELPGASLTRGTHPIHRGCTLMTQSPPKGPTSPYHHFGQQGFSKGIWGTQTLVYSTRRNIKHQTDRQTDSYFIQILFPGS